MAGDDLRYYETFYGVDLTHWKVNFGSFNDHTKLLVKEYVSDGCSSATSTASQTLKFIYPHHIKKKYFIEGVIDGHITVAASGATAIVDQYRVSVCKANVDNSETELFTTGWVDVDDDNLPWDSGYNIGEERVYPFWIDAWNKKELSENDRIYVKVEVMAVNDVLWHSNDATWEDLKITIPFVM